MVNFKLAAFLFVSTCLVGSLTAEDLSCAGWELYKDERCFKLVDDTFRTYADAEKSCTQLGEGSTLPVIHSMEEQEFLSNLLFKTNKKLDSFWVGAKNSVNSTTFKWNDNTELDYTNWDTPKAPRNKANHCIQMQSDEASIGKWIDEPCEKKNLVVCQKTQSWSMARMQKTLSDARKEFRQSIEHLKQSLIPIGFVYAQLPNTKPPSEIWPWMTWTDDSSTYSGVFFRVTGDGAAPFGQVQGDSAPRLTEVSNVRHLSGVHDAISLRKDAWSEVVYTGSGATDHVFLRFHMSGGEVRPRNMAVHIWRRTG